MAMPLRAPPRKKGPPGLTALRIQTPVQTQSIVLALDDDSTTSASSALSSATSEVSIYSPFSSNPPSAKKNMKKLSLNIASAQASTNSLSIQSSEPPSIAGSTTSEVHPSERPRRLSVASLPATNTTSAVHSLAHRREEQGSPSIPYVDGPTQIIPGVWLGSEDNARDWKTLLDKGIRSILNVAKEVVSPFDTMKPIRHAASTPNFKQGLQPINESHSPTYYAANVASGRPSLHYLKLDWSHGQQDLVEQGFPLGMTFIDEALERGEGVLIHCQCGISRSATMVIALVMRAAAEKSKNVPREVWELKGMQGAYGYVKDKSKWVGPNMSLVYQLLDYERKLQPQGSSERSSEVLDEEEEWSRMRREMEEAESPSEEDHLLAIEVTREARALDKAMEERMEERSLARKTSGGSMNSNASSAAGVGMGQAWRSRYGQRKRAASVASNGSLLSEHLVEEDEEEDLLGIGGGFDSAHSASTSSASPDTPNDEEEEAKSKMSFTPLPLTARRRTSGGLGLPPPSAPVWKTSFGAAPPPSATRSSFNLQPPPSASRASFQLKCPPSTTNATFTLPAKPPSKLKGKRPVSITVLPPVPSSPITLIVDSSDPAPVPFPAAAVQLPPSVPRSRKEAKNGVLTPINFHVRTPSTTSFSSVTSKNSVASSVTSTRSRSSILKLKPSLQAQTPLSPGLQQPVPFTPSQTLFVFPPSSQTDTQAPSTMTLTLNVPGAGIPFPSLLSTPRVSTFRMAGGRSKSFIGLTAPATPTTASSRVDAKGWLEA